MLPIDRKEEILLKAIEYTKIGLKIFPVHSISNKNFCTCGNANCTNAGKHPVTKNGFRDATNDIEQITKWFKHNNYNIGAIPASIGAIVLDVDKQESLNILVNEWGCSGFDIDDCTVFAKTGGGGQHYWFKDIDGIGKTNSTGKLPKGIDIRGSEGYVLMPPSLHKSGNIYSWANIDDVNELLLNMKKLDNKIIKALKQSNISSISNQTNTDWVVAEGSRDNTVTSFVGKCFTETADYEEVLRRAKEFNIKFCKPSLDIKDIERIVCSIYKKLIKENKIKQTETQSGKKFSIILQLGSDKEIAQKVLELIKENFESVVFAEGDLWAYKETHWGIFSKKDFYDYLSFLDGISYGKNGIFKLTEQKVNSIFNIMSLEVTDYNFFEEKIIGVNCKNGFLEFRRKKNGVDIVLNKHNKDYKQKYVLNYDYDEKALEKFEGSLFEKLLKGGFSKNTQKDNIQLIKELMGVVISGCSLELSNPKVVFFYGAKAQNGKSQVIDLIKGLIAENSYSNIPIESLGDRFLKIELKDKLLNFYNEIPSAEVISSSILKNVISGSSISGERKHKNPVKFNPYAQHIYAANTLPLFDSKADKGIERRVLIIDFDRRISESEKIINIAEKILKTESELVLAWAVEGAKDILTTLKFSETKETIEELAELILTENSAKRFFKDVCVFSFDFEDSIAAYSIYEAYKMYCERNKIEKGFSQRNFSQFLLENETVKKKRTEKGIFYSGIKIKDASANWQINFNKLEKDF